MNYFPYFRGKQYELICIRENVDTIFNSGFVPIIEPVKEQAASLKRALEALKNAGAKFLVVANPAVGDHVESLGADVEAVVRNIFQDYDHANWIYHVRSEGDVSAYLDWSEGNPHTAIFHDGYSSGNTFAASIQEKGIEASYHVFTSNCSKSYRKHFTGNNRIIIANGFAKQSNKNYQDNELLTDLNVTYSEENMNGFGDYLIVGSEYSESGGPAYAVAIHITYLDQENDGAIYVRHFISDTTDTPTDPAGKFREALAKLVADLYSGKTKIKVTPAIEEFIQLYATGHFPGLGYVKKLSMQHHLELLVE